ncbi:hypothetical protein [Pseudonocardia sp. NPDC049635]|uniref:hypothetical protein n=1 Tax=Pseudonocardia sp. NPDC049635 TaxID=3155506 RepID=UPI0033D1B6F0
MQLGSVTVPPLALAAVLGAVVLLVVWILRGAWGARRGPAHLPVAPPAATGSQPCAEDWTGESAGGPADPPPPARPRTVADIVAERRIDTSAERRVGTSAERRVGTSAERRVGTSAEQRVDTSAEWDVHTPAGPGVDTGPLPGLPVPSAGAVPGHASGPAPAAHDGPGRHARETDRGSLLDELFAPADERPDEATRARTRPAPVSHDRPQDETAPQARRHGSAVEQTRPSGSTNPPAATTRQTDRDEGRRATGWRAPEPGPATVDGSAAGSAARSQPGVGRAAAAAGGPRERSADPDDVRQGAAGPVSRLHIAGEHPGGSDPEESPDERPAGGPSVTGPPATETSGESSRTDAPVTGLPVSRIGEEGVPGAGDLTAAPLPPWSTERTVPAHEDLPSAEQPGERYGDRAGPVPPPVSEPVSRAVQQALAARAVQRARMRRDGADPDLPDTGRGEQQELPLSVVPSVPGDEDARDRLLAVLIADPARAVDATRTLDDSQHRIEELGDVLRRRRAELAGAVRHLSECGLDPAQIGRLAGMAPADVRTILDGEDAGR